ncbi:MAG TPA: tRNA lysidine(34) synthetase TilS, partial [Cellvibrionaceae bacterium]|nr:tRNA lysidine(34) synthetase TilS [Cellvibrionaceae bacterium]
MAAYGLAQGNGAQGYCVALSGGLDSMVLAHLAKTYLPQVRLLHINHGLSPFADQWQQQVEHWAAEQNLPCHSQRVLVARQGESLEAAARKARYAVFEATLSPGEALLCGHHLNDQAETFFLRLLRGSGLAGLTGMAPARPIGAGVLLRPLLGLERGALLAYAQAQGLTWVEDESNSDERFERNWLRHSLLPQLTSRWPKAAAQVANTCLRLQEEQQLLQEYLASDLASCSPRPERLGHSLDLTCLQQGSSARRNSLLRLW